MLTDVVRVPDALDDLRRDVDLAGGTPGDVLTLDVDEVYRPAPPSGGGGGVTTFNGLFDVDAPSPADLDIPQYDVGSSQWVNRTLTAAGIATAASVAAQAAALVAHAADVAAHAVATSSTAGFMPANDKSKVDNLPFRSVKAAPYNANSAGSTDATTAINTAIDDVEALGGGIVMVPEGTYRVDSQIVLKSNVTLRGHPGSKIIRGAAFTGEFSATIECQARSNVKVEGITVDGNRAVWASYTDTTGGGQHRHGLRVVESDWVTIRDCKFHDNKGDGYYVGSTSSALRSTNVHCENCLADVNNRNGLSITDLQHGYFGNCRFTNHNGVLPKCGAGIEPNNTANVAEDITFDSCLFANNAEHGFYAFIGTTTTGKQEGWRLINCTSRNNTKFGMHFDQCKVVLIVNNLIYSNGQSGISIFNNTRNIQILFGKIYSNAEHGVFVNANANTKFCESVKVIGCAIQSNNTGALGRDGFRIDWSSGATSGCTDTIIADCTINNDGLLGATQRFGISLSDSTHVTKTRIIGNTLDFNASSNAVLSDASATRIVIGNTGLADQFASAVTFLGNITSSGTGTQSFVGDISITALGKRLLLPAGTTNADGIRFGTDTFLFRTGANALKTDGNFAIGGQILVTGSGGVAGDYNGGRLTNLGTPSAGTDAATKDYVDSVAQGLDPKASVRVATAAALPSSSRIGSTLTATGNGTLPAVDGVTLVVGDRVLVCSEGTAANNGIYDVTSVGSAGSAWILTRAADADTSAEVTSGMYTFSTEGTANTGKGWILATPDPITLNTTALSFALFTGGGGGAGGTLTSVALTMPGIFGVAGSPVTGAGGTFTVSLANQSANNLLAGPTAGGAATPAFRLLVEADIPALAQTKVTNLTTDLAAKASIVYVDAQIATRAATAHTHAIIDVTNLQTTLDGKASLASANTFTNTQQFSLGSGETVTITKAAGTDDPFTIRDDLDAAVFTVDLQGVVTAFQYIGSGAGLTNIPATELSGDVPDANLSANVPLLNAANAFTLVNTFAKRIRHELAATSSNNYTPAVDDVMGATLTHTAAYTINNPSGTPQNGDILRFRHALTNAASGTWGNKFVFPTGLGGTGTNTPPAPGTNTGIGTASGNKFYTAFFYVEADDKWECVSILPVNY